MASHYDHPIYKLNCGSVAQMPPLPLPPAEGHSAKINTYEDVPLEPKFDPKIHLDLERPEWIRLLPNFEKTTKLPKVDSSNGSPFAYSSPFNVSHNKHCTK